MSTQTPKLISFFQKAFQAGTGERDPEKYLAKYRSEIEAAGKVFQYLDGTWLEAYKAFARSNYQIQCWFLEGKAGAG